MLFAVSSCALVTFYKCIVAVVRADLVRFNQSIKLYPYNTFHTGLQRKELSIRKDNKTLNPSLTHPTIYMWSKIKIKSLKLFLLTFHYTHHINREKPSFLKDENSSKNVELENRIEKAIKEAAQGNHWTERQFKLS